MVLLLLNWMDQAMHFNFVTRLLKAALLPAWFLSSFTLNLFGLLVDRVDKTGAFYSNIFLVVKKS